MFEWQVYVQDIYRKVKQSCNTRYNLVVLSVFAYYALSRLLYMDAWPLCGHFFVRVYGSHLGSTIKRELV